MYHGRGRGVAGRRLRWAGGNDAGRRHGGPPLPTVRDGTEGTLSVRGMRLMQHVATRTTLTAAV